MPSNRSQSLLHHGVSVEESATCGDCSWRDDKQGARGRGARHHKQTGHRVTTEATYERGEAPVIPGQTNIYDILGGRAA